MIYINEPLTQKLPAFYRFMGGWEFVRSTQKLKKLVNTPRHWNGTAARSSSATIFPGSSAANGRQR